MALSQVIFKTLQLLTLAGGVSMSPQVVKHVKKWINDTFYAPPAN
ncbi:hypothetical protein [Mycoplasma wenyonii]|nr:hypothetical protein [Mycoplasma wenyonii]